MTESAVAATDVEVPVDPDRAFRIFTEEIDDWWVRSPTTFMDGGRARGRRIEPGVGGRLLEVYDDAAGDVLELGRITVWEPGKRLVLETPDETEADFRFEATGSGTRVSVEHRLLPGRDPVDRDPDDLLATHVDAEGRRLRVTEVSGEAGDVIVCHSNVVHAAPVHTGTAPRFLCVRHLDYGPLGRRAA